MSELLPKEIGEEVKNNWIEFEERTTEVGKFCAQLDKIEMCVQAGEYESKTGSDLSTFFDSIPKEPKPELASLCTVVNEEHKAFLEKKGKK